MVAASARAHFATRQRCAERQTMTSAFLLMLQFAWALTIFLTAVRGYSFCRGAITGVVEAEQQLSCCLLTNGDAEEARDVPQECPTCSSSCRREPIGKTRYPETAGATCPPNCRKRGSPEIKPDIFLFPPSTRTWSQETEMQRRMVRQVSGKLHKHIY